MNSVRRSLSGLITIVGLATILPSKGDTPAKADAFLDQSLPVQIELEPMFVPSPDGKGHGEEHPSLKISSFLEGVMLLGKMSGKKAILPDSLGEWPGEHIEKNWNISFGVAKDQKVRGLFEMLSFSLGLDWHYDATQEAILLNPEWELNDPRSSRDLVQALINVKPVQWYQLHRLLVPNSVGGHSPALDAWRVAFDALLSKPENFPYAGTLRLYHDTHGRINLCPFPVVNLFTGKMSDHQGHQVILILNGQVVMDNKESPGDVAYYLFDENGRFIKGGVYAMADGLVGSIGKVHDDGDQKVTIDVGWGSFGLNPDHIHFGLINGDFVLLGSTDFHGKERSADETRTTLSPLFKDVAQLAYVVSPPK